MINQPLSKGKGKARLSGLFGSFFGKISKYGGGGGKPGLRAVEK
jgi:hypothetical protein